MKVRFIGSFYGDFPEDDFRDVVFAGRSNVGKSSLINMLLGTDMARVSKEPGRTRAINFFFLEEYKTYLVDLPGYGFAKVSKREREEWRHMIDRYFEKRRENIRVVFLLIDARVGPTQLDLDAIEWLSSLGLPYLLVLTKSDRAGQKEISQTVKKLREATDANYIITSAKEGRGKRELWKYAFG